ncbi:MAG: PilZ domain-containing protein [Candidatus Eremiobacteraeota bacterium]|nr:PilZ domain-containing protein [Candidatus Eremiobacteraeota bacterium]MBV8643891.1 PilZ domain-containing protein [Candidatus Eremiobacteraeota bacterium]
MLRLLGLGPKPLSQQLKLKLPAVNAFVELMMTGNGPRGSVCVESLNDRTFTVTALPGVKPGGTGVFSYQNPVGKFRFSSKCAGLRGNAAVFVTPERIETIQVFSGAQKRAAVRIDATVPAQWRFAPSGKGTGDYVRASLTDISRSGASLIVDREVKRGTFLEFRFGISTAAAPLVLLGEVMRTSKIETSGKNSLGLRFHGLKPDEDRAIMEFINKRQAERRNRGLA